MSGQHARAMKFTAEEKKQIIVAYDYCKRNGQMSGTNTNLLMEAFNKAAGETVYTPQTMCSGCAQQIMKFWRNIIPKWKSEQQ